MSQSGEGCHQSGSSHLSILCSKNKVFLCFRTELKGHQAGGHLLGLNSKGAEARRTTILHPVEQKPHSQKDRKNGKAEEYVPDEGTR